jgi:hypothetical protein
MVGVLARLSERQATMVRLQPSAGDGVPIPAIDAERQR